MEYWCVTANVKKEMLFGPNGKDTRFGTKQFKGGAKVYVIGCFPGMCENVIVIGQNKHNGKYIESVIRVDKLENFRPTILYGKRPVEIRSRSKKSGSMMVETEENALCLVGLLPEWQEALV